MREHTTNNRLTQLENKSISGIRIIPELNIAALNQGKDKELMLWYCLRSLEVNGCDRIPLLDAKKAIIKHFHYNRITLERHLRLGMGKLWKVYENGHAVIEIRGVKAACLWLSTSKLSRYVDVDIVTLGKYPRKALLWNTGAYRPFGTGRLNNPISRASLEDKTRIPRRYQQRYDVQIETEKVATLVKTRHQDSYRLFKQKLEIAHQGKTIYIDRSLGNIYVSHGVQSHRGMLKKMSKLVREGKGSPFETTEVPAKFLPVRRFFSNFKDFYGRYTMGKVTDEDVYYPQMNKNSIYVQAFIW